ncbi:hypothetical protein M513_08707 [Trichuris suis]|uniref:Uncharacterized protein n=1 Tax=Trichuris suis TaxID=68888 RepID=A0A085LZT4_9BILA|nr:hypothetical protein M513_08707 [Trichuris suis]
METVDIAVNPAVITLDSDMESKKKGGMAGQGENEMPKMPPNFVLAPPGMTAPPRAVEWNFPYIPDPKANTGSPAPYSDLLAYFGERRKLAKFSAGEVAFEQHQLL